MPNLLSFISFAKSMWETFLLATDARLFFKTNMSGLDVSARYKLLMEGERDSEKCALTPDATFFLFRACTMNDVEMCEYLVESEGMSFVCDNVKY